MAEGSNGQMDNGAVSEGASCLDSFFANQRRDVMFEIRKLKHGDKPVTEGESKQNIEKFFAKCLKPEEFPDDQCKRPENVVLDIDCLFESRPVSNLLRSMRFRKELEGVVRGTVNRQDQEMERAQRLRVAGLVMAAAAAEHFSPVETLSEASASVSSHHSDSRLGFPQIPPPPPFILNPSQSAPQFTPPNSAMGQSTHQNQFAAWQQQQQFQQFVQWQQQQQQQQQQWQQPQQQWQQPQQQWQQPQQQRQQPQQQWQQPQQQRQQPQRPVSQPNLPAQPLSGVLPQRPWLLRNENPQNAPPPVVNLDRNRREDFIADISSLVQQQLVSSTLGSNFRGRLEYILGDRLANGEFDGQRVSDFVQSLRPRRHIQRNDFRHLGINAPRSQEQQSREETALPSLEFESLRRQMEELKNMVQLTFDLQMDMQRAIRQEVAAAMTGHSGMATLPQSATPPANEGHCLICLEKSIDSVLYQCGHMCVCLCCGLKLKSQGNNCPMCRAPIRDVIRAYRCHDE